MGYTFSILMEIGCSVSTIEVWLVGRTEYCTGQVNRADEGDMFWMACPSWKSGKQLALRHVLSPNRHPCGEPTIIKILILGFIAEIYLSTLA